MFYFDKKELPLTGLIVEEVSRVKPVPDHRRYIMGRIATCRDVGVDCDIVARGETDEEIFRQCARHAKETHGRDEIPEEHRVKMRMLIREERAA